MRNSTNTIAMKFLRRSGLQTKNRIKLYEKVYSRGKQGAEMGRKTELPTPARFLPTSLAFYCWTIHAKTKISRNGVGASAYATCDK